MINERVGAARASPSEAEAQDELFGQLSHPVRRRVLHRLVDADGEGELPYEDIGADATLSTAEEVALHHVHLPKLAAAGYVDWCPGEGTVRRGPRFGSIAPALELLDANRDRLPGE